MAATERVWPDVAIPPGEVLAETLEARGMTQAELARRMERPAQAVNEMVQGAKEITPETALQLERVLGVPAHIWTRLEADYRSVKARLEDQERLKREARMLGAFPYAEMAKHEWVSRTRDQLERVEHLLGFFGVVSLRQAAEPLPAAFRKSTRVNAQGGALAAWLRQAEHAARRMRTQPFDAEALSQALGEVRAMTRQKPEVFQPRLTKLLADCGVAFVVIPHLRRTGAHGATRWIGDKAIMQVSLRYKWADIFWFTVFHELGHLLKHGRKETFIEYTRRTGDGAEREADVFAAETLIPMGDYERFCRATASLSALDVRTFARSLGIAEGIVVGRLQYDGLVPHTHLNNLRLRFQWVEGDVA